MNLRDTVRALEAKGIVVAIDLGVHELCDTDSNCPIAIQLRRLIAETGITFEQLLEGYQEVTAPNPVSYETPEINAVVRLGIAGKTIEIDLNDVVSHNLKGVIGSKLSEINRSRTYIRDLGGSLYHSYLTEIRRHRDSQALPQISFDTESLIVSGCMVTTSGREYVLLFPAEYKPQYLVDGGIRYKLTDADIRAIKRKIYLKITVTQDGKLRRADVMDESGDKLTHYHGDSRYDCWGDVVLPERWDGSLASLTRLVHDLIMSLITINRGSILTSCPYGMPHVNDVWERCTELGREGEVPPDVQHEQPTEGTGWGVTARRRRRRTARTPQEERIRRFSTVNPPTNMELVCTLCGERAGHHYQDGTICPRDH